MLHHGVVHQRQAHEEARHYAIDADFHCFFQGKQGTAIAGVHERIAATSSATRGRDGCCCCSTCCCHGFTSVSATCVSASPTGACSSSNADIRHRLRKSHCTRRRTQQSHCGHEIGVSLCHHHHHHHNPPPIQSAPVPSHTACSRQRGCCLIEKRTIAGTVV